MALTDGITPVLYGIQSGIFRDAGLDVQLNVGGNGAAQTAAVVGGSLDVAASTLMSFLAGYARGIPLKIIAGSTVYNPRAPSNQLCVLKSSKLNGPADMNGSTVAVYSLGSLDQLGILSLVDRNGGSSATLRFIEVPGTLMLGTLQKGTADVASVSEPQLSGALAGGALKTVGDANAGIDPRGCLIAAFVALPDYIEQNRDTIDRFVRALYRATAYTNSHHPETAPLLASYTHMDLDVVRRMTRQTIATSLDARMIQPSIDVAFKYKFLDRRFDAKELLI